MSGFHPYFTNDGSVGLYNEDFQDIYHSATGALTEAYEKFILPVNIENLLMNDSIKVLDICYGIGYNSKSFLNFIFENYFLKIFQKKFPHAKSNIEAIHTNNIPLQNTNIYNGQIYTNNIFSKIYIKAIDNDKFLTFLSPFIKTGVKNFKNDKLDFEYKKIEKYLDNSAENSNYKIQKIINFLIFEKIVQKYPEIYENIEINKVLCDKRYSKFFKTDITGIFKSYKSYVSNSHPIMHLPALLHNIYYRNISNCYKKRLKGYKLLDINFDLEINDARSVIKNDNNLYNLIFLDAFTPSKCPCLWSYEFFKLLYEHMEPDGMLLTYSNSASVRSAMIEAGFHIGRGKYTGTIAVKNVDLIDLPFSEFDLGLFKTKAGIFYRDENLTDQNEAIIERRNLEVKNSNRISSSEYKRTYNIK
ncbi:hypothetical protein IJ541_03365 [bacterium]|nr:hypothetical protein [bacterium]